MNLVLLEEAAADHHEHGPRDRAHEDLEPRRERVRLLGRAHLPRGNTGALRRPSRRCTQIYLQARRRPARVGAWLRESARRARTVLQKISRAISRDLARNLGEISRAISRTVLQKISLKYWSEYWYIGSTAEKSATTK